jgi:hypothetical protein
MHANRLAWAKEYDERLGCVSASDVAVSPTAD